MMVELGLTIIRAIVKKRGARMDSIKVLLAGKGKQFEKRIKSIVKQEKSIEIVGNVVDSNAVVDMCFLKNADICLLDEGIEGLSWQEVTESIVRKVGTTMVVVVFNNYTKESMKEAISNGAKEVLEKPSLDKHLYETLKKLYDREVVLKKELQAEKDIVNNLWDANIISVFSPKGGVGKTTVTTNIATALALEGKKVLVIDSNLQFGDSSMALKINPNLTVSDLVNDMSILDNEDIDEYIAKNETGVYVISAPLKPEQADLVTPDHIKQIVEKLRTKFQYIVLDCPNYFNDIVLGCFDISNRVLLIATLDITTIKNISNSINLVDSLNYPKDLFEIVLNKVNEKFGVKIKEFEETLNTKVWAKIPYDDKFVIECLNVGTPCVVKNPKNKVSKAFFDIVGMMLNKKLLHHRTKDSEKNRGFSIFKFLK